MGWIKKISPQTRLFISIAAVVAALDQWSKYWAVGALTRAFYTPGGELSFGEKFSRFLWERHPSRAGVVTVLEDFWRFRYAENPGAAWSFLATAPDWFRTPFFLVVASAAMVFIVYYFKKTLPEQKMLRLALALVFGGAVGNLLDRARLGYVIDFIDWHWYNKATWPTFNVADVAISIGVVLMLADMIVHRTPEPSSQNAGQKGSQRAAKEKDAVLKTAAKRGS